MCERKLFGGNYSAVSASVYFAPDVNWAAIAAVTVMTRLSCGVLGAHVWLPSSWKSGRNVSCEVAVSPWPVVTM